MGVKSCCQVAQQLLSSTLTVQPSAPHSLLKRRHWNQCCIVVAQWQFTRTWSCLVYNWPKTLPLTCFYPLRLPLETGLFLSSSLVLEFVTWLTLRAAFFCKYHFDCVLSQRQGCSVKGIAYFVCTAVECSRIGLPLQDSVWPPAIWRLLFSIELPTPPFSYCYSLTQSDNFLTASRTACVGEGRTGVWTSNAAQKYPN